MSVEPGIRKSSFSEWLWLAALTLGALLLSSTAYLTGYKVQSGELIFSGAVVDRMDYSVHMATMHLGERGEWRYRLRFSAEQQQGAFVKSGYIFLGHVARWLRLSLPAAYHLGRIVFGLLVCVLVYLLASQIFPEPGWRRLAWLLAIAGGGLGWLQSASGWVPQPDLSPIDFWLVDAYTFFSMLAFPHFLAVIALLLIVILIGLEYLHKPARWHWLAAGAAVLLMQFIQPFAPVLADMALLGAFTLHTVHHPETRLKSAVSLLIFGAIQIPLLLYNLAAFSSGSGWASFTEQNVTLSPPLVYYAWGFAPFWIPALAAGYWLVMRIGSSGKYSGGQKLSRDHTGELVLAAAFSWALGAMLLAYAPTSLQRRFLLGYTIPLGFLATGGLRFVLLPWLVARGPVWLRLKPMLVPAVMVALACMYAPVLALGQSLYVSTRPAELFDRSAWVQSVDWLQQNAGEEDVVLAGEQLSRLIAARAGLPVFSGHPMETLDYEQKSRQVTDYFSGSLREGWLFQTGARWVIFTERDQQPSASMQKISRVFEQTGVVIFEVLP